MSNADQAEFWSGAAGQKWVALQDAMDATLQPVLDMTLKAANLQLGEQVLDIGCGAGTSVKQAAQAVGPNGFVQGVDISPTLLARARKVLEDTQNAAVLDADAQVDDLGGPYDVMISRFGVMFFDDTPAAFAHIAHHLRPGARLVMTAWADARQNPFFMEAAAAARDVFGPMPKTDRSLPGPFAFEDADRVRRDLSAAGLTDITIDTEGTVLPMGPTPAEAAVQCLSIGPAESAMRHFEASDDDRDALRTRLMERFSAFQTDTGIACPALIHVISARVLDPAVSP